MDHIYQDMDHGIHHSSLLQRMMEIREMKSQSEYPDSHLTPPRRDDQTYRELGLPPTTRETF